jgi:hypothetical protein
VITHRAICVAMKSYTILSRNKAMPRDSHL